MKSEQNWLIHFFSIITILGIFVITSLILTNAGMHSYKNIVIANNNNFQLRTSLSYVATKVRQSDHIDSVSLLELEGQNALILKEEIEGEGYVTCIYYYDGYLYELFQSEGMEYDLVSGTRLMEISEFYMKETEDGMLQFTAKNKAGDMEQLLLSLRSGR